jgi:hypothetical protein
MELRSFLQSISQENVVDQMHKILTNGSFTINIDWQGQRMIEISPYRGQVEINELALTYFTSVAFHLDKRRSLQERKNCFDLWKRIKNLYKHSEILISKTMVYRCIVPLKERFYSPVFATPMMLITSDRTEYSLFKNYLFGFTKAEYQKKFPGKRPVYIFKTKIKTSTDVEIWVASENLLLTATP